MSVKLLKSAMRKKTRSVVSTLNEKNMTEQSKSVFKILTESEIFLKSKIIGIFISTYKELNTLKIIEKALNLQKEVYCPKTHFSPEKLSFHKINSVNEIKNFRKTKFD
ncbi:hypothetical protein MHBO_004272 [Bonamia ostreae]|uniref:5-formyltetrahydrofolate cyclo-ligase n=1 Tax=Bonamia ostreae TaxID=126728 RepID=A0ABV2AT36_9EUKA